MKLKRLLPLFLSIILSMSSLTMAVGAKTVSTKPNATLFLNKMNDDNTSRTIKVKWKKMKNVKSYEIQRSRYKNFKKLASGITTTKRYRTYSLKSKNNFDNNYYIRVRAKYKKEYGKWSNTIYAKKIPNIIPQPILEYNKRTSRSCSFEVSWDKIENAKSYHVQMSKYKDFHELESDKNRTETYAAYACGSTTGINYYYPATLTYYVRVQANMNDGTTSQWSKTVVAEGTN